MSNDVWTVQKVLDFASDYFKKASIETPHLEAEILLANALGVKRIDLYINFEKTLSADELAKFKRSIQRRKAHEPTAYIVGSRAFMSLDFTVTADTLIPRPETELLVESAISLSDKSAPISILDIGTGSGAVAVSLAKYLPCSSITAVDISEKALEVARKNAQTHKVDDRIAFAAADIFPDKIESYDLIVSNPPYIKSAEIANLQPEVKDHEPVGALDGGKDGLDCYRVIIPGAKSRLKEGGRLIIELDPGLILDIKHLLGDAGFKDSQIRCDLNGHDRVIISA